MIAKGKRHIKTLGCLDMPLGLIWGISKESTFYNLLEFLGTDELLTSNKDFNDYQIDYSIVNNMQPKSVSESMQILPLYDFSKVISTAYSGILLDYNITKYGARKMRNTLIPEWQAAFLNEHLEYDISTNEGIEEMVAIGASMAKEITDKLSDIYSKIGITQYSDKHFVCIEQFKSGASYFCIEDILHFMLNSNDMYSPKVIILHSEDNASINKKQSLIGHPLFNEKKLPEYIYNIENGNEQFDYFDFKLLDGKIVRLHSTEVLMPLENEAYDELYS